MTAEEARAVLETMNPEQKALLGYLVKKVQKDVLKAAQNTIKKREEEKQEDESEF